MSIQSDQGGLPTENNDDHHGADGTRRMTLCSNGADRIVGRRSNHPPASRAQVHENPGQTPGNDMRVQEVMIARVLPILVALGFLIAGSRLGAQNRPLPDQESFLIETRKHLQTDGTLQSSYVYVETRREQKLDKGGLTARNRSRFSRAIPAFPAKSAGAAHRRGWPAGATGRIGQAGSGAPAEGQRDGPAACPGLVERARAPSA